MEPNASTYHNTMKSFLNIIHKTSLRKSLPQLKVGQTVRVYQKIIEGDKTRVQYFEGLIIMMKGSGTDSVFTVRKMVDGVGVEKSFLLHSPSITKITVLRESKVRRSKLYYMRHLSGKSTRLKVREFTPLSYIPKNYNEEESGPVEEAIVTEEVSAPQVEQEAKVEAQAAVPTQESEKKAE